MLRAGEMVKDASVLVAPGTTYGVCMQIHTGCLEQNWRPILDLSETLPLVIGSITNLKKFPKGPTFSASCTERSEVSPRILGSLPPVSREHSRSSSAVV